MRSYEHYCTESHQNSATKRAWARVVLGWVSSLEALMCIPLFGSYGYYSGLPLVVLMGSALRIAIGVGRSSIRASDRKIRAVEIARLRFLPVFCDMEDPIIRGRSTEMASFLDGPGAWNGSSLDCSDQKGWI